MEDALDRQEAITTLLETAVAAGEDPVERLWPLIYDDLRLMAHRQLQKERAGHTLVTTALVNEVYVKLADRSRVVARGKAYFFAAAARAMRQILVDHARHGQRLKRGGEDRDITLQEEQLPTLAVDDFAVEVLDLHEALKRFAQNHQRAARVVEGRFFGGLTETELAGALNVSERTVRGDWALARAWLFRALNNRQD